MTENAPSRPAPERPFPAVFQSGAAVALGTRDAVRASGDDTADFLQGQLSQDVKKLDIGASAWSLLLQPQGKVDAYLRVTRLGENEYILDIDTGFAEPMLARLNRFKLRTKCDLELLPWQSASVRGEGATAVQVSGAVVAATVDLPGFAGVDYLGETLTLPEDLPAAVAADVEAARIIAGVPMMGRELTENTIPAAAGIVDGAVSFDKGCYTGQELVARIDSRGGNVPHRLVGLRFKAPIGDGQPALGDVLRATNDDGGTKDVGWLTSIAVTGGESPVGLGYLARAVETPAEIDVIWAHGPTQIDVVSVL